MELVELVKTILPGRGYALSVEDVAAACNVPESAARAALLSLAQRYRCRLRLDDPRVVFAFDPSLAELHDRVSARPPTPRAILKRILQAWLVLHVAVAAIAWFLMELTNQRDEAATL
jgi:hypothetical protein